MSEKIKKARKIMRDALKKDENFKQVYVSNVAMLLHDRHGIKAFDKRNNAAEEIIDLIFSK